MKKKTRFLAITGGICAGVGVVFLGAGIVLGGTADLADAMSVKIKDFRRMTEWLRPEEEEYWDDDIHNLDSNRWKCFNATGIRDLEIELEAGYLEISPYDGKDIKVYTQNNDTRTEIEWDGMGLNISSELSSWFWKKGKAVKVLVPESQIFEMVYLDLSAGEAVIDSFKSDEIYVSADAASVTITGEVQVKNSEWSVGAGSIEINRLQSKTTELDCSAGEIQVIMSGSEMDYFLNGDVSAGSLEYGDSEWDGLSQSVQAGDEKAKKYIEAECSAGDIVIDFAE